MFDITFTACFDNSCTTPQHWSSFLLIFSLGFVVVDHLCEIFMVHANAVNCPSRLMDETNHGIRPHDDVFTPFNFVFTLLSHGRIVQLHRGLLHRGLDKTTFGGQNLIPSWRSEFAIRMAAALHSTSLCRYARYMQDANMESWSWRFFLWIWNEERWNFPPTEIDSIPTRFKFVQFMIIVVASSLEK